MSRSIGLVLASVALFAGGADAQNLCLDMTSVGVNESVPCDQIPASAGNDFLGFSSGGMACGLGTFSCANLLFGWSLSSSSTDPMVNSGPLNVLDSIYLWYVCPAVGEAGVLTGTFAIQIDPPFEVLATLPQNGFLNAGTGLDLLLAVGGCPTPPVVALELVVADASVVDAPLATIDGVTFRASPNPSRHGTQFVWSRPVSGLGQIEIFDLAGCFVSTTTVSAGATSWSWNGRDRSGGAVGPGVYLARLSVDGRLVGTEKITRLR